jgi:hypothetical protein
MEKGETLIDNESLINYVADYTVVPDLRDRVQLAQDEFPDVQPLGLRLINIERIIDDLAARSITTIEQLDRSLNDHKSELMTILNDYDREAIAARHVFTPIYILLDIT